MDKQRSILARLGEEKLTELLGREAVDVLASLDQRRVGPKALADLLVDVAGPGVLVSRKDVRTAAFDSLNRDEATDLAQRLGLPGLAPWSELAEIKLRKGSDAYSAFISWLGLDPWEVNFEDEDSFQSPKEIEIQPDYPLFPHQIDAVNRVQNALSGDGNRVILHMPTGAGKTRSAMNVIADLFRNKLADGRSAVWLAHSEELCEQAASEFERAWQSLGNRKIRVVRHFGSHASEEIGEPKNSFVVISLQSAHALAFSRTRDGALFALGRSAGLVVIDEAHKATADTYRHVLELLAPRGSCKLLGLTATPGRSWLDIDEDEELADFFDRKKVTLDVEGYESPVEYLVAEGYLAKVTTEEIKYDGGADLSATEIDLLASTGDVSRAALKRIGEDTARNLRILLRTEKEAKDGGLVILFACSVEHANTLTALLKMRGVSAACVTGSTSRQIRHRSIERFKAGEISVLCNYGVLSTGFDAPKANVAIIARPTDSLVLYSQMVGRVIRGSKANGTNECKVITVVDQKYGFRNLGEAFTFWDDLWMEQ
ncbi:MULTISPECIES: DEAD/DEAH box helicase [unclassified Ruegeria]|uniref:DEAD/DEAH box helicase n=1 Tax=unclassified Ruegeria TaxID=2625375 RepID=UPI0014925EA5|nr:MULTISPECIES: DEAD/DEAH box helicase [unclassified Ruegeria]NOD36651.1 DEAD/DEAH box helicase family protein [Ruegeria sp. HKCCD7296]NOE43850.1 DEAD/DEAH box helicase family protein [Ruegeria sp. HKCCD7319]